MGWRRDAPSRWFGPAALLLFCSAGMFRLALWQESHRQHPILHYLPLHTDTLAVTVQSAAPRRRMQAVVETAYLVVDTLPTPVHLRAQVVFPRDYRPGLLPGDRLLLTDVTLEPLPDRRNPGQFDYGGYLRRRGIVARCAVADSQQVLRQPPLPGFSLNRCFALARRFLEQRIEEHFPPSAATFLKAVLLGERGEVDREVLENFQNAGVIHVLAISGLHVGYVAVIISVVLSFFPIYFKRRNWLVILCLVAYMFLTGSKPPVVRATLMAALLLLAINRERRASPYNYLFAAAFCILLFQPQQLFWVGFQFSFAAVLSILYFYRRLEPIADRRLERLTSEIWRYRLRRWVVVPFLVSLSAQIGTAPLVMHYFHQLSLVAFGLNIVVIPLIGLVVALGFLFLGVSLLHGALAGLLAHLLTGIITGLFTLVHAAAHLPGAYLSIPQFGLLAAGIYLSGVLLLFHLARPRERRVLTALGMVGILLWGTLYLAEPREFNLLILDVGQGDAALITTPGGKTLVIDAGPADAFSSAADRAIIPALRQLGGRRVNYLFLSHPHADHVGGAFRLLAQIPVDSVFLPPVPVAYHWNDTLRQVLDGAGIPFRQLQAGDRVVVDEETRCYVLGPVPSLLHYTGADGHHLNNNSLVLLLRHRKHSLLFVGDAEREAEACLQRWDGLLRSEFLKVGHHGSDTSTGEDFLALVQPQYAAISVGAGNKFGHPSPRVLNRLRSYGVTVFRTDRHRAIWLRLRNDRWQEVQWK